MTYLLSSAGALIVDRNTWASRANQAWGPSDVWNSGNSWEYLTGYHGWVGRTYNSGESWEAAYNRVYTDRYNAGYSAGYGAGDAAGRAAVMPAGSAANASRFGPGTFTFTAGESVKGSYTADKTGRWLVRASLDIAPTVNGQDWNVRAQSPGGSQTVRGKPDVGTVVTATAIWEGIVSVGQAMSISGNANGSGISDRACVLECIFIPTPTYPH